MASNKLMGKLIQFAFDDGKPPAVQLDAIKDSLNRAGLKPPAEVVLSQVERAPYEEIFDSITTSSREESRAARGLPPEDGQYGVPVDYLPAQGDVPYPGQPQHQTSPAETYGSQPQPEPGEPDQTDHNTRPCRPPRAYDGTGDGGPARQVHHVTGEAALEQAAQLAIESRHKRYPRP